MSGTKCQLCAHSGDGHGGFLCPACARAALYPLRIQQAALLLDKEDLAARVESVVSMDKSRQSKLQTGRASLSERNRCIDGVKDRAVLSELEESRRRIDTIAEHATRLRAEMEEFRRKLATEHSRIKQRRSSLSAARSRLMNVQSSIPPSFTGPIAPPAGDLLDGIVAWRVHHLHTLGFWARLQRARTVPSGKGPDGRNYQYQIGGLVIPDLRSLNHLKDGEEQQLTAALTHICRLLHLVSRYLQIRLPAEIVVPHRDWPLPMILSPLSSYTGQQLTFPHKALSSPHGSRIGRADAGEDQYRTAPRPRPLFLLRPLRQLAVEDAAGYARFVEAVAILAWDIAWLCRVQGLSVAESDWEEACDIGCNMWRLLVQCTRDAPSPPRTQALSRRHTGSQAQRVDDEETAKPHAPTRDPATETSVGLYSHGTAHNFLRAGNNLGAQADIKDVSMRGWALGNPVKIISELRASLMGELAIMEAVLVGDDGEELGTAENGMQFWEDVEADTAREKEGTGETARDAAAEKAKGASGWMKLRTR